MLVHTKRDVYGETVPEAERFFEAALELDVQPDGRPAEVGIGAGAAAIGATWLAEQGLGGRPIAALVPGAAHFTKRWPLENWEMLGRELVAQGYDVAVLTGTDFLPKGRRSPRRRRATRRPPGARWACRRRRRCSGHHVSP